MSVPEVPPYEIITIEPSRGTPENWKELREQCHNVRLDVFHHEQGFPVETELDEFVRLCSFFCTCFATQLKLTSIVFSSQSRRRRHALLATIDVRGRCRQAGRHDSYK